MKIISSPYLRKLKNSLFRNPIDIFISIILFTIIIWLVSIFFNWFLFEANWQVVTKNISLFIFGSYPKEGQWRPVLWLILLFILTSFTLISSQSHFRKVFLPILWFSIGPLGIVLLAGVGVLMPVRTAYWGGLSLTLILTILSSLTAIPLGILLAFGRQSEMLVINRICGLYIDFMRSIPLIAVLFFGQLLIPLFLPIEFEINRVIRAIFAFALFASSYIAEDIRGGLQAIPMTQREAALVLGLNKRQVINLILLPQALRIALPSLTNQIIGLLQNTSLMAILGLIELLGISRSILANPEFIGNYLEVYIWLACIYWTLCTLIALLAKRIEYEMNPSKSN